MPALRYVDPYKPRGRIYLAICRLSATRVGMWLASAIAWKLDPILLKLTGGRLASTGPVACAVLETCGARSGLPRRTATLYFHDGNRVTLVTAKQGRPTQPAWYFNIRKHPDVVFGGVPFRASVVEDEDERARLWLLADRVFPQFDKFQQWAGRAGRTIPIVQLTAR